MRKERPLICTSESVAAILELRKTQTRRVMNPQPRLVRGEFISVGVHKKRIEALATAPEAFSTLVVPYCPKGVRGDLLWIKEKYRVLPSVYEMTHAVAYADGTTMNVLTGDRGKVRCLGHSAFQNPMFMKRVYARVILEIVRVWIEPVQAISEWDAKAEGAKRIGGSYRAGYAKKWDEINGRKNPWTNDPWVWCIEFGLFQK